MKRITKKALKELQEEYTEKRLAKKRNSTFFHNYTKKACAMLAQQERWVGDKCLKQDFCENFNELGHDVVDDIEDFIRDIETDASQRNWSTADFNTRSLISQNID